MLNVKLNVIGMELVLKHTTMKYVVAAQMIIIIPSPTARKVTR